jgi:pyruvate,water dikinase
MREYPKSDIVRFMELGRKALYTVGEELVINGKIENPEDIFFLYQEDVLSNKDLKKLIVMNKENYNKEMKRTSIPRIIMNNGATYYNSMVTKPNAKRINGMPLSPGVYEGRIRVVFDPMNTELKEGEILVTESTNPAWTPLFATAGALIMEYGGPMSHGGIVAREYGIPAVVGIPSATLVLKDGQKIRVNGETGVVEILD